MIDLDRQSEALTLDGDVCVVGAGAAGITLARRLLARGRGVILLESGGLDYEAPVADLNAGANAGLHYYDLGDSRLRFFGGTTAIWGGRCAELDPIDLERRDYVPHSGWPIGWNELAAYYEEARPLFGLPATRLDDAAMRNAGVPLPRFEALDTPVWTFDPAFARFSWAECEDLRTHPDCRIVTHASVTAIHAAGNGIESIEAKSLNGGSLTVRARHFVLAAGGIENARLLLASGIANERDQVGRYFMEHPHARGGRIVESDAWRLLKAFGRRHRIGALDMAALIAPSAELQRREGILNTSLTIVGRQPEGTRQFWGMQAYSGIKHQLAPTRASRGLWMATKRMAGWAQRHVDPARPWLLHKLGRLDISLLVRGEQAPNPDSRVTLGTDRDALGVPRATLDWRMSEIDTRSVRVLVETLGRETQRLGLGRVEPAAWLADGETWRFDSLVSSHPIGGYHHMGTTRMGDDPRSSVTDAAGRVHGITNLSAAGSSLFPTGGWANPTLTIAALALRQADIIAKTAP